MPARRPIIAALCLAGGVVLVAAMVKYTRRVESDMIHATGSSGTVKFLKARADVPSFTAPDLSGKPVSIDALRGKVVLINFWATWCPPCREEIPDLIALQTKYKDQLQIVGISQDSGSIDEVRRFAAAQGMNYPSVLSTP